MEAEDGVVVLNAVEVGIGALGSPAGEGDVDDEVVMLAGTIGAEADVTGGVCSGAEVGEFAEQGRGEFQVVGDFEVAAFESELEGGDEIALGDVPGRDGAGNAGRIYRRK